MYEENPDTLPSFSYIKNGKELENLFNFCCISVRNPGKLPGFRPPLVHT